MEADDRYEDLLELDCRSEENVHVELFGNAVIHTMKNEWFLSFPLP